MKSILALAALMTLLPVHALATNAPFEEGRLDYAVNFNGKRVDWHTFAFFVLPDSSYQIRVHVDPGTHVDIDGADGEVSHDGSLQWHWQAPAHHGLQVVHVKPKGHQAMTLNVLVMVPMSKVSNGYLNGYRIGQYPAKPLRNNPIYLPPPGLVEVTPELVDLPISPHFTLGQFLCKQQPDHWPKYLVLREALIAKLEIILAEVNRRGMHTDTFHVMSGFRTPWYNQAIGNGQYSRHVWGGAADIFIDTNGNGRMDDLNGDGHSDIRDAKVLLGIIDDIYQTRKYRRLHGGLGLYGPRAHRGPFVHVDARGHEARWSIP